MIIEQIYTGCLAHGAYYIESEGEAAIVDPLRESEPYIQKAERRNAKYKYILETHFHADFVSGHVDLAEKTGATIVYGPNAKADFDFHLAKDEEILELGKIKIKVLHTPGHTMESTTFLLIDENGKEHAIFTGDTLFIGDVGRPDLAQKGDLTQEKLASYLFHSLRGKIMGLPDEVIVYPGHGAGSACGKKMSSETTDTLGNQKQTNYALRQNMTEEEFIKEVTDGLMPPPGYFPANVALNKAATPGLDKVMEQGKTELTPDQFENLANQGALMLDTRSEAEFVKGHIPNSIFIGLDGSFAMWVGWLIKDLKQSIIFIADEGREEEVITRLSRVGYDNTQGFLKGGVAAWDAAGKQVETVESVSAEAFQKAREAGEVAVLDVRKPGEFEAGHVANAQNLPLDYINENMDQVTQSKKYYVHCAGGYRSVIASSILKSRGFHNIINIEGGYKAIADSEAVTA